MKLIINGEPKIINFQVESPNLEILITSLELDPQIIVVEFNGKILCANMKACKLIDIIKVWNENFGGSYKIIKGRKGDRVDEYLIGDNEIKYTTKIYKNKKIFYLIDFEKKSAKPLDKIISSENASRLSESEIYSLLKLGLS